MRAPNRNSRGYSLIELLTVMAIIGVLSLITVPSFISFQRAGKMKSALRNFTMDLRTLRQKAISQNVYARVEIRVAANETIASRTYVFSQSTDRGLTWTPLAMRGGFGGNTTRVIGQGTGNSKELERAVFFESTEFPDADTNGTYEITFHPNGTVEMPASPPTDPISGSPKADIVIRTKWNVTNNRITIRMTPSGQIHTIASHV